MRIIQHRYKQITTDNSGNRTNRNLAVLRLLQAKEYYYRCQFSAWGKFHPGFTFSERSMRRHYAFMNWLFPEKNFKEWDTIIWHKSEAVTYYHNKIWDLQKGVGTLYELEIPRQIKKWKDESEAPYKKMSKNKR